MSGMIMPGLFRFINYLNQVEEKKLRSAAACLTGGREDAVRVMSIHRSKGWEISGGLCGWTRRQI